MADRSVKLTLDAKVDGLVNGLRTAKREVGAFGKDLNDFQNKHRQSLDTIGDSAGKMGLAVGAGLGLAAKAAMDWESAWTGVLKTNEGSEAQLGALEGELRELAKTLPSTHTEIAAVAEAAGQLGVGIDDVSAFTKVMIDLGESTNLSAEEAATSIARFSNVMGTANSEAGNIGAALVGLGNNFATTESEIMGMAQRLSGAGAQIDLSEGQVLGLATAMSSVGIEAEAGGTAMSLTMKRIEKAVDEGGTSVETFASTAGMSVEQFSAMWENDAAGALEAFVVGLGEAGAQGESVNAILSELGITGIRESDALLRLASAGELMGEAMATGAQEYEDGTALIEEATKRYETAESKIAIAWNKIKDAAIEAGGAILPVIAGLAEGVGDLADWFGNLPPSAQGFLTTLGAIVTVAGLGTGAVVIFARKAAELAGAFRAINGDGSKAATAVGKVGRALSSAAAVGVGLLVAKETIEGISNAARSGLPDVEEFFNIIATGVPDDLAKSFEFDLGGPINPFTAGNDLEAFTKGLEALDVMRNGNPFTAWSMEHLTIQSREVVDGGLQIEKSMQAIARAIDMGQGQQGIDFLSGLSEQMQLTDEQVGTLIESVPELKNALLGLATEQGLKIDPNDELGLVDLAMGRIKLSAPEAADAIEGTVDPLQESADAAQEAADAIDDYFESLVATGQVVLSEQEAHIRLAESINSAAEARKENGKTLDLDTEKGQANRRALIGIADATLGVISSMHDSGRTAGEMAVEVQKGRDAYIAAAVAAGMNADEAARLADEAMLVPENVFTEYESNAEGESQKISDLHQWIQSTPDKKITITDNSPVTIAALRDLGYIVTTLPDGRIQVSETGTTETGRKIDATAGKRRTARINAEAITGAAERALNAAARDRTSRVSQVISRSVQTTYSETRNYGQGRQENGGRVRRRYSEGGRLPMTGLGTDKILGMDAHGNPTAWVDDGEWVINRRMSDKYHSELRAINEGTFPKLAGGGLTSAPSVQSAPDLEGAFRAAMATMRPLVVINGRQFYGVMQDTQQQFGTRR